MRTVAIVADVADDEELIRQERRLKCPRCPFQLICSGSIWPESAFSCPRCYRITLHPSNKTEVRCTESTMPYSISTLTDRYYGEGRCVTCAAATDRPVYEGIVIVKI